MHQNNWVDSEFGAVGSKRLHKYISEVNGIFFISRQHCCERKSVQLMKVRYHRTLRSSPFEYVPSWLFESVLLLAPVHLDAGKLPTTICFVYTLRRRGRGEV